MHTKLADEEQHSVADVYRDIAKLQKYKKNYVAVDEHAGSDLKPVFNNLVMISEMRAFEIQQVDYKDRFSVFSTIIDQTGGTIKDLTVYIDKFNSFSNSADKLKYLCSLDTIILQECSTQLPEKYCNFIFILGIDRIRANGYNITEIQQEYDSIIKNQSIDIDSEIKKIFKVGDKYSKNTIKEMLRGLYTTLGYTKTPKATDLMDYFELKIINVPNSETGKRDKGFEIIKEKT